MYKTEAAEQALLTAGAEGIAVTVNNVGTDGLTRSEKVHVYFCISGEQEKLPIFYRHILGRAATRRGPPRARTCSRAVTPALA